MNGYPVAGPQVLALLHDARERPEDDTPRLVLADYLEDVGDADRAEFLRLQCRLAAGQAPLEDARRDEMELRCEQLLARRGGGWLGPLWRWPLAPMCWHRGLLSVRPPRGGTLDDLDEILPWVDTALFALHGRGGFRRVADFLTRSGVNHLTLDLRTQMREDVLLEMLSRLPESACLRSLTVHWPITLLRRPEGEGERPLSVAAVSEGFLATLLGELPVGRHLTRLGTSRPFGVAKAGVIRGHGVEPVHAADRLWMHRLPPAAFQAKRTVSSSPTPSR